MALSGDSVSTNFYSAIKPIADGARCFHRYSLADVQAEQYRAVTHKRQSLSEYLSPMHLCLNV